MIVALRKDLGKTFEFPPIQSDKSKLTLRHILDIPADVPNQTFWSYSPQAQNMVDQIPEGGSWKNIPYENLSPIFNDVDSKLTLRSNYKDLIDEKYLKGQKISLSKLAAWTFRFSSFEFDSMPNEKQFSRVLDKAIKKYFKITKNDFLWLFEDDISNCRLIPDTDSIKGQEVRNQFDFDATKMPEVNAISAPEDAQVSVYDKDTVAHYLACFMKAKYRYPCS